MLKNYILFLTLLLVSACSANTVTQPDNVQVEDLAADQPCRRMCPALYAPTCGFDGANYEQFVNPCMLEVKNCHLQAARKAFLRTHIDWCTTQKVDNLHVFLRERGVNLNKPECIQFCTHIFDPVTVSNGEYRAQLSSSCQLNSVNCALKGTEFESKPFRMLKNHVWRDSRGSQ